MAVPKYDELFEPVLRFLSDGQDHTAREMRDTIVETLCLTKEECDELLPSKRQRVIDNRIGWARTYLKKAGLMSAPKRGTYRIERAGLDALASGAPLTVDYLRQFESFCAFEVLAPAQSKAPEMDLDSTRDEETPDETLERAYEQIVAQLADELIDEVMKLTPSAFERMVLDLMSAMGYGAFESATKTTPVTDDEGIDGIIMQDKLGFDLIYVQTKRYALDHCVGRPDVQGFVGAIAGRGGKGLFVTTSRFSQPAIEYAEQQHIILVDGQRLARLMIEHDFGVTSRRVFAIKSIDTDTFAAYAGE